MLSPREKRENACDHAYLSPDATQPCDTGYDDLKILKKARQAVLFDVLKDHYRNLYDKGDIKALTCVPALQEKLEECFDRTNDRPEFGFITVNAKPGTTLQLLHQLVQRATSKKWITDYAYCLEQRSEDPTAFTGFHSHILLFRGSKRPSEVLREFKNTFKSICDVDNPHCLNVKWVKKDSIAQKVEYMMGRKADEKMEKVKVDKAFREHYGLAPMYSSNACPFLLVGTRENSVGSASHISDL